MKWNAHYAMAEEIWTPSRLTDGVYTGTEETSGKWIPCMGLDEYRYCILWSDGKQIILRTKWHGESWLTKLMWLKEITKRYGNLNTEEIE